VLNETNRGLTGNSNAGLRACTGQYLAYMGGDDVLLPGKISAQVNWLAEDPKRVLCGHQVEVFYDDNSRAPHPLPARLQSGHGAEPIIRNGAFGATSVMVRADKIPAHGFEERLPVVSDHMLWVDILADGGDFGYVDGTYARYRRHDANVTNDPFRTAIDVEAYLKIVANRYPQYRRACDYAYVRRILYDMGVALLRAGRKDEARAKFVEAIRREPLFLKAWVRAAQCLV
jgi:glycosyltransferase involved in cell wall biosynthesis